MRIAALVHDFGTLTLTPTLALTLILTVTRPLTLALTLTLTLTLTTFGKLSSLALITRQAAHYISLYLTRQAADGLRRARRERRLHEQDQGPLRASEAAGARRPRGAASSK